MKSFISFLVLVLSLTACASDIIFTWDANPVADNVISYRLYREVEPGMWQKEAETVAAAGVVPLTLTVVRPFNFALTYAVAAVNAGGEGERSDPVTILGKPGKPINVKGKAK